MNFFKGKHVSRSDLRIISSHPATSVGRRKEARELLKERESKPKRRTENVFGLKF